jgi:2',3'-cyclic-nucleotide 2'-phosphodiesterase (5'-nucleotidase family)
MNFFIFKANSTLIQILHTNDTHSFLDSATRDDKSGGVARQKNLIDMYKAMMKEVGIETLTLDAGDFTEGNLYFLADSGRKSFLAQSKIGYDAVTMGNHEYLMGERNFDKVLSDLELNFKFLAANIIFNDKCPNAINIIRPYSEFTISGIKIGILGVTTNEVFYNWRFGCGKITNPIKSALRYENILRKRNNQIIIALTHLGIDKDSILAKKSRQLDMIIGGHSHSELFKPIKIKNKRGKEIPIFQAGFHTNYLGRIILEVKPNEEVTIISSELIPIKNSSKDTELNLLVKEADQDLEKLYGSGWLETIIGKSDLKPDSPNGEEKWAYFITDTIKEKVNADIGIHSPLMNGEAFPVGQIDRKMLINSIPRIFNLNDKYGWSIYSTSIRGVWLQAIIKYLANIDQPIVFSGIEIKKIKTPLGMELKFVTVNGQNINPFKNYKVALTEGVVLGALGISKYASAVLRNPKKSNYKIWASLEEKLNATGNTLSIENIKFENHTYFPVTK